MKKVVNVKLEKEEWVKQQDKAFEKLNKKAKIDGFRPGKAPRDVYEKHYGKQEIIFEAANKVINDRYENALAEAGIVPEMEPKIDLIKCDENELEFSYTFMAVTNIELGDYKNLGIKKEEAKVTKKEIEHEIHHILERFAEIVEKKGKVANGDIAIIDFEGFKDGTPFEGGKGTNYQLEIGSNTFIPGFEEGIVGMSKGEEKDLELTFPKDYHDESLKGQKVVFKVKVNEVKQRKVPKMDEDFFLDLDMPGVNSKEELEKEIEKQLKDHKQHHLDEDYTFKVLDEACKNMKIDIEDEMIDVETNAMYDNFINNMKQQGIDEELYYNYSGTTKDDMLKKMRDEALRRMKYRYLLNEVVKQEKIKVTDKEAELKIDELTSAYNVTREEVLKELGSLEAVKYEIMMNKAIEVIKSNK